MVYVRHQTEALRHRQESRGQHQFTVWSRHAQEHLIAFFAGINVIDDGLVYQHELVFLDGLLDALEPTGIYDDFRFTVATLFVHMIAIASLRLGREAGRVSVRQHLIGSVSSGADHGDPDAAIDAEGLFAFGDVHFAQNLVEGVGQIHRIVAGDIAREHSELIATEARDHVLLAYLGLQQFGDTNKKLVARGVSVRVIDLLELIEVNEINRALDTVARDMFDLLLQRAREITAVHKTGQRIAFGHFPQHFVPLLECVDGGIQRIADDGDFLVFRALHVYIDFAPCEPGERDLQFRQRSERAPDHPAPEKQREQQQGGDNQAARGHAAHHLFLVVAGIDAQVDVADDLLVFFLLVLEAEIEQTIRTYGFNADRRDETQVGTAQQRPVNQIISFRAGGLLLQSLHLLRFEQRNIRAADITRFTENFCSRGVVVAYEGDFREMLDALVDIRQLLASLRGIEWRSEFVELGEPPNRLLLEVVLNEAAGRPPQADIDDQVNYDRAEHLQRQQPADETAASESRHDAPPEGHVVQTFKPELADGFPLREHRPSPAMSLEFSDSNASPSPY